MMDDELTLIETVKTVNEMGDIIEEEKRISVLCDVESVTRSEFYTAASHDMQPEIVFVINKFDYENQSKIEYSGSKYDVIRTYKPNGKHNPTPMNIDRLELVCKGAD